MANVQLGLGNLHLNQTKETISKNSWRAAPGVFEKLQNMYGSLTPNKALRQHPMWAVNFDLTFY